MISGRLFNRNRFFTCIFIYKVRMPCSVDIIAGGDMSRFKSGDSA